MEGCSIRLVLGYIPLDLHVAQVVPERELSDTVDALTRSVKLTPVPRSRVMEITDVCLGQKSGG